MTISDQELLSKLQNYEDQFVERKSASENANELLKTVVAFANSAPIGSAGILYVGVTDEGMVQAHQRSVDDMQKDLNKVMRKAYPRVTYHTKTLRQGDRQCLVVIVPASDQRPHFSGPAYVRKGSETVDASEEQFAQLIAYRNSKCFRILEHKNKPIRVSNKQKTANYTNYSEWGDVTVFDCDQFCVALATGPRPADRQSFPLNDVDVSFDNARGMLHLIINR